MWGAGGDTITVLSSGQLGLLSAINGKDLTVPDELAGRRNITALALSSSGLVLAVGTGGGDVLLWQQNIGRVTQLRGGGDPVTALAWRPDGGELCVARPRSIQFWRLAAQTMISSIGVGDTRPFRLVWAPDDSFVAVAGLRDVRVLDLATRGESAPPLAVRGRPTGLSISRSGSTLLVGLPDGSLELLDRQLMRSDGPRSQLPAGLVGPADLHVNETGLVAMRTDAANVSLVRLPDSLLPSDQQRTATAVRRWATAVAEPVDHGVNETIPPPVPEVIARRSRFAWVHDGWIVQDRDTDEVVRSTAHGHRQWSTMAGPGPLSVTDRFVATGGANGRMTVLSAANGTVITQIEGTGVAAWSGHAMAVAAPGRRDLLVYDLGWTSSRRIPVPDGAGDPVWSPDGAALAAASASAVVFWDGQTLERMRRQESSAARRPGSLAWSPDGSRLAVDRPGHPVTVWSPAPAGQAWTEGPALTPSAAANAAPVMAWSPDSRLLAIASQRTIGAVDLWDVTRVRIAQTVPPPPECRKPVVKVDWAADGRFAVVHDDGTVTRWSLTIPSSVDDDQTSVEHSVAVLAELAASTAVTGTMAGLPVLADLLSLMLGHDVGPLAQFNGHPGVAMLRSLRWPPPAAIGLAVLIASGLPAEGAQMAPDGVPREELRAAVEQALERVTLAREAYQPPVAALRHELNRVDDSVLVLAGLLGPDAIAAEPYLLARVRSQSFGDWSLAPWQRRLLGLRALLDSSGNSQGHGLGDTRAGIARNGELPSLLPSQLALPRPVLAVKKSRDELLFRTRQGSLPLKAQPVVLLLDDTAAAFGAIGVTIRFVANLLAGIAVREHRRCALVPLGSPTVRFLNEMADLVHVWAGGNVSEPDLTAALAAATAAAAQLSDPLDGLPRLVLLTHPYMVSPARADLFSVRVQYPGLSAETSAPRTYALSAGASPEEINQVIGEVLGSRA